MKNFCSEKCAETGTGCTCPIGEDGSNSASVWVYEPSEEYIYAKRIAKHFWENHYKETSPDWEALPDMMGILSQIDNMIAGL